MSALVIDASVVLSWLLPDEASPRMASVQREFLAADAVWAPAHWRLEVCNALWMAERRKRLDAAGLAQAVALFSQIAVMIDPHTDSRAGGETLALAREHGISLYDAAYLELAMRRGAALGTLDHPLRKLAKKLGVPVLPRD